MAATVPAISVEEVVSEEDATILEDEEVVAVSGTGVFSVFTLSIAHILTEAAAVAVLDITEASMTIPATAMVHRVVQEVCLVAVDSEGAVTARTSSEKVLEVLMIENISDPGISCDGGIFCLSIRGIDKARGFPAVFWRCWFVQVWLFSVLVFFFLILLLCA